MRCLAFRLLVEKVVYKNKILSSCYKGLSGVTLPDWFKPYMLTPTQIVTAMLAQYGVATGDDVNKLQNPLSQAMTSLSDLIKHMANFLLASQRLTRSGQGETPYRYFKLFLETVVGFPSTGLSLTTYYAQHPAIANQSVN
jgi:hypothetical protein